MIVTAVREHEICAGHRVAGHESKCRHLHGHGYVITFHCQAPALDAVGRVIDFGVIKSCLCQWLEDNWDHSFLMWEQDDLLPALSLLPGLCMVPFNPTAENMAIYLLDVIGPQQLARTGVQLTKVTVQETRKCGATATLEAGDL